MILGAWRSSFRWFNYFHFLFLQHCWVDPQMPFLRIAISTAWFGLLVLLTKYFIRLLLQDVSNGDEVLVIPMASVVEWQVEQIVEQLLRHLLCSGATLRIPATQFYRPADWLAHLQWLWLLVNPSTSSFPNQASFTSIIHYNSKTVQGTSPRGPCRPAGTGRTVPGLPQPAGTGSWCPPSSPARLDPGIRTSRSFLNSILH